MLGGDDWNWKCFSYFSDISEMVICYQDWLISLSNDRNSRPLGVDLSPLGNSECDILEIGVFYLVNLGETGGFFFVAEHVVSIREDGVYLLCVILNYKTG